MSSNSLRISVGLFALGLILLICSPCGASSEADTNNSDSDSDQAECHSKAEHYEVVRLEWLEVQVPFGICIWILIASLAKLAFHNTRLPNLLPESCLLIIIGFVVGGVILIDVNSFPPSLSTGLDANLFFLFLLPPIMLEAGYFMPSRSFFDNIGTILLYAVVGTVFNTVAIGFSLYGLSYLGWYSYGSDHTIYISVLECLTFSSLISAVDPVAVLAVFEEVHVNEVLYILVFGESVLNDAVTVVLYRMHESFGSIGSENLEGIDFAAGFLSFFVVSIGGVAIGFIYGFLTALLTRLTHKARVIEPMLVFAMSYMAYLTAEMFRLSSILAIVFCAIFMKPYVEANISQKSHTTLKYFLKMMSSISETLIFIFLGITTLVNLKQHEWNTVFVFATLFFCLLYRTIGVIVQTWIANTFRLVRIRKTEQFIMAYGGLRGAIAFSLVALLCKGTVPNKPIFFTACIVVIMFTVFIQGATIKPLVDKLKVKKAVKHKPSMNEEIFGRLRDHLMVGVEDILGQYGHHHWRDKWEIFNKKVVQRVLLREPKKVGDPKILTVFSKLNEKDAMDYIKSHGSFNVPNDQSLSNMFRSQSADALCLTPSPSYSALPFNDSMPCLDMQQIGKSVPKKHIQDSSSHHLDLLADNMYKPQRQAGHPVSEDTDDAIYALDFEHGHRRSSDIDSCIQEPANLMHRSMKLQLRRISRKHRDQQKPNTKGNPLLSLALHNTAGDRRLHKRNADANNKKEADHLPESKEHPGVIITPHQEEDEGIMFTAHHDLDDVDGGVNHVGSLHVIHEELCDGEENTPAACEKVLPWKTENDAQVSVRAEINPQHFSDDTPSSPWKSTTNEASKFPLTDSTDDDCVALTAAEQMPWKSSSDLSSSQASPNIGEEKPPDGAAVFFMPDVDSDEDTAAKEEDTQF